MRTAAVAEIRVDATAALAALDRVIGAAAKLDAIKAGMADALSPVVSAAKAVVQQPGKPEYWQRTGARKTRKHLRDTIGTNVRVYNRVIYGVAGPHYPAGAAGHLLEHGHRIVTGGSIARVRHPKTDGRLRDESGRFLKRFGTTKANRGKTGGGKVTGMARPFPFMRPAMDQVRASVLSSLTNTIRAHVERAATAGGG